MFSEQEAEEKARTAMREKGITFNHFKREVKRLRPMTYYTEDELVDMYTQCGFSFMLENNCHSISDYLDNHQV